MKPTEGPATDATWMGNPDHARSRRVRRLRRMWRRVPSSPRCKMCTGPFGTPGGPLRRLVGDVLVAHEAIVDKFVGDAVIGIFVPALTDGNHATQAIEAAVDLLRATGHGTDAPWVPVGIGINTGPAYVGVVGTAEHVEFTALGDTVNITARLSALAGAGEILLTDATAPAAALPPTDVRERRHLDLRGRSEATDVVVVTLSSSGRV